jgi:integrase
LANYLQKEYEDENSIIKTWFDNIAYSHSSSENTRSTYGHFFKEFCNYIGKTPNEIISDFENSKRDRDFSRKYSQHLRRLISIYTRKGYSSGSIKQMVSAVRSFFKYNDLPLGHIPMPRMHIEFHNRDIKAEEIREILKVSKPREKAFYVMMTQTGLRPDTLCHLKIKHIEPDFSKETIPCKVEVPEELTKGAFGSYFTFMAEDAMKYLKNYLYTRRNVGPESYIFTAYGKTTPLHRKSISSLFARTLETLKENKVLTFTQKEPGKPRNVRLYNLRKFFRKYAGQAGIEYVNFWMGHKTNYQAPNIPASDVHYFSREDVEFQRKLYMEKASPFLRVETKNPSETEKEIAEFRTELNKTQKKLEKKDQEIQQLKNEMGEIKENTVALQNVLDLIKERGLLKKSEVLAAVVELLKKEQKESND